MTPSKSVGGRSCIGPFNSPSPFDPRTCRWFLSNKEVSSKVETSISEDFWTVSVSKILENPNFGKLFFPKNFTYFSDEKYGTTIPPTLRCFSSGQLILVGHQDAKMALLFEVWKTLQPDFWSNESAFLPNPLNWNETFGIFSFATDLVTDYMTNNKWINFISDSSCTNFGPWTQESSPASRHRYRRQDRPRVWKLQTCKLLYPIKSSQIRCPSFQDQPFDFATNSGYSCTYKRLFCNLFRFIELFYKKF